jgi:1-acyl-sn-glycerol-3-phosphate acyltransferase
MPTAGSLRARSEGFWRSDSLVFVGNILFIFWYAGWTALIVLIVLPAILCLHRSWISGNAPIAVRRFIQVYGYLAVRLSWPMIRVSVLNRSAVKTIEPCIYVLNHFSFIDVFFCGCMPAYKSVLAIRAWPFRLPFYNIFMRAAEYLNVEAISGAELLDKASELIRSGTGLLFFPEGHRSRTGQLLPLRKGAFRIAAENRVPVVPVAIRGTEYLGGYRSRLLRPSRVVIRFYSPLYAEGCDAAAVKNLRDRVKALFERDVYSVIANARTRPTHRGAVGERAMGAG